MDSIMIYNRPASEILKEYKVSETKYKERYAALLSNIEKYIGTLKCPSDSVSINKFSLSCMLIDYFIDVSRLKDFHKIQHINSIKIVAYTSYWFLRRKPIQINSDEDRLLYANEKFITLYILDFLMSEKNGNILTRKEKGLQIFNKQLLYYLKYRPIDPQGIEMMLLSFFAGQIYQSLDVDLSECLPESECSNNLSN